MSELRKQDIAEARRWFVFLRSRRRDVVAVETRLANLLGCHASKVFNAVTLGAEDDCQAFDELLRITGHGQAEPSPVIEVYDQLLELLRDRQYRRGKHG